MSIEWTLTIDCASPAIVAQFWKVALGYVDAPPPEGFQTWEQWLTQLRVPQEEWDDGASLVDPDGRLPRLSFLKVPEDKVVKNRMHFDIQVGGGRATPIEVRWPRVMQHVERLVAAGATVIRQDEQAGQPDHVVMADPEGNEFCVL
jgi:hypothetical protein